MATDLSPEDHRLLVERTCAGDAAATEALFAKVFGPIAHALGRRWDYPDLPNQLFVHLCANDWRRLRTWDHRNLRAWTRTVCRNLFLAEVKDRRPFVPLDLMADSLPSADDPVVDRLVREEDAVRLMNAIDMLPVPRDRMILRMHFLQAMSLPAIAAALGVATGTVYVIKLRALKRLRAQLEGMAGEVVTS